MSMRDPFDVELEQLRRQLAERDETIAQLRRPWADIRREFESQDGIDAVRAVDALCKRANGHRNHVQRLERQLAEAAETKRELTNRTEELLESLNASIAREQRNQTALADREDRLAVAESRARELQAQLLRLTNVGNLILEADDAAIQELRDLGATGDLTEPRKLTEALRSALASPLPADARDERIRVLTEALKTAEAGLSCCYDVEYHPADGESAQDVALATARAALLIDAYDDARSDLNHEALQAALAARDLEKTAAIDLLNAAMSRARELETLLAECARRIRDTPSANSLVARIERALAPRVPVPVAVDHEGKPVYPTEEQLRMAGALPTRTHDELGNPLQVGDVRRYGVEPEAPPDQKQ